MEGSAGAFVSFGRGPLWAAVVAAFLGEGTLVVSLVIGTCAASSGYLGSRSLGNVRKRFDGYVQLTFCGKWPVNETRMIMHKHTLRNHAMPCHAMPCHPCRALA